LPHRLDRPAGVREEVAIHMRVQKPSDTLTVYRGGRRVLPLFGRSLLGWPSVVVDANSSS
jgi:hypothetical protein